VQPGGVVPGEVHPAQPLPFASIASQKHHIGLYLFCVYMDEDVERWFAEAWRASGKRLDMGRSCVRVERLEDVPLDVLGALVGMIDADGFVALYEAGRARGGKRPPARRAGAVGAGASKRAKRAPEGSGASTLTAARDRRRRRNPRRGQTSRIR
jgi:hypothetical protein